MKVLFFGCAMVLLTIHQASAVEMLTLTKSTGTGIAKVTDASFEKAWTTVPSCIKNRGTLLKVNKAFVKRGLKYGDCSDTPRAKEIQKVLGYTVVKFNVADLSEKYMKMAMGKK
jgi:hypothetical protein